MRPQEPRARPATLPRRRLLAMGLGLALGGCGTGPGASADSGTAIIGLRIEDTPALRERRASYSFSIPLLPFAQREASASLSFGLVEPSSGRVDLPMFASLRGMSARVATEGHVSSFEAERLVPGRYLTREAWFRERPDSRYQTVRVLHFSGSDSAAAEAGWLGGFAFTVDPGETVYVGTMVLALERQGAGGASYAPPRVVDEFELAAAEYPELARLGRARGTRLMAFVGDPMAVPPAAPAAPPRPPQIVPPVPPLPSPQPVVPAPLPGAPANVPRVG